MIIENPDINLCYYTADEIFPYKRYNAGDKDEDKSVYKNPLKDNNYPILIIEEDIINAQGYGLRRGFYEVKPNSNADFLLLYQSGQLRAKVPVVRVSRVNDNPKSEKISAEKKKRKYKLGKSPDDYINSSAQIFYDTKTECYIIFYEYLNTKMTAVMKI